MFEKILKSYETFKEPLIKSKYINEQEWAKLIEKWERNLHLSIKKIGESEEGRPIHEIKIGNGPIKLCLWSQMHGNEATATMALADIFNLLAGESNLSEELIQLIDKNLSIHIIPLVNPDGAIRWTRETSLGIDMNRDARRRASREGALLYQWASEIQPDFSFNLHDQNRLYSVGNTKEQTHFAFLAPPLDEENTWTEQRMNSAKIANRLIHLLKPSFPGKIAKWKDDFEPRAFGDNFQKLNFGVLLIEAGGMPYDFNKFELRKFEAAIFGEIIKLISTGDWEKENLDYYNPLKINERNLFDVIIKNIRIKDSIIDLGLNIEETWDGTKFSYTWVLEEMGDLDNFGANHTWDNQKNDSKEELILGKEYENLMFINSAMQTFNLMEIIDKINKN